MKKILYSILLSSMLFAGLEEDISKEDLEYLEKTPPETIIQEYANKFIKNTPMEIDSMTTLESVVAMPNDLVLVVNKSIKTTENQKMEHTFNNKEELNSLKKKIFEEERGYFCSEPYTNYLIMNKLITFSFIYVDTSTKKYLFRYSIHSKDCK